MWTLYEICLNLFQSFLFVWFVTKMLPKKHQEYYSTISCILLTTVSLSSYLFFSMPTWDTWIFVFLVLYAVFFFKGSLAQRLFWCMIPIIVSMGLAGVMYYCFSLIMGSDRDSLLVPGATRIIFTLITNFLFWITLFHITQRYPNNDLSGNPSYLPLITDLLCIILIDLFFSTQSKYNLPYRYLFVGCGISILIGLVSIIANRIFLHYIVHDQELRFQERELKENILQMESLNETYKTTLKLRHDLNAYVNDIKKLVDRGELQCIPEYIHQIEEIYSSEFTTANLALDSVLSIKVKKIHSMGIDFRGGNLHYTGLAQISDLELCSIVSNMLDNAVEALTERITISSKPYIQLEFMYYPAGLMILCENPLYGELPKTRNSFIYSQKEEQYHGLGISIIDKIAQDAGGRMDIIISNDLFRILVYIPLKRESSTNAEVNHETC